MQHAKKTELRDEQIPYFTNQGSGRHRKTENIEKGHLRLEILPTSRRMLLSAPKVRAKDERAARRSMEPYCEFCSRVGNVLVVRDSVLGQILRVYAKCTYPVRPP